MKLLKNNLKTQVFLLYLFSRIIFLFTPTLGNHPEFIDEVLQILAGQNPYAGPSAAYIAFPPFHYLIYTFFVLLFGPTNFAFKMCTFVFDIGTFLVLYKIVKLLGNYEGREWIIPIFFAFFPTTLLYVFESIHTVNTIFFFTLTLYLFLKKRYFLMGIFAGLGMLVEIFPVFLIYIIAIIFFAKRQFRNLFLSLVGFACAYLCVIVPFFGLNIFDVIIIQLTRQTTGLSLLAWLPEWTIVISPSLEINVFAIITVSVILCLGAWIYYFTRHNDLTVKKQVQIFLWFYLFLPILFLNVYDRYFFWTLPLLIILMEFPKDEKIWKRVILPLIIVIVPAIVAIFLIYPAAMFENLQDFVCGNLGYPNCAIMVIYSYLRTVYFPSDIQLIWACLVYFLLFAGSSIIWIRRWNAGLNYSLIKTRNGVYENLLVVFLMAGFVSSGGLWMLLTPIFPNWLAPLVLFTGTGITIVFLILSIVLFYSNIIKTSRMLI